MEGFHTIGLRGGTAMRVRQSPARTLRPAGG